LSKYYTNDTGISYSLCNKTISNCEKCNLYNNYLSLRCDLCEENYYFLETKRDKCYNNFVLDEYYTEDNGISYYSCDEGFINYWNENIRPNENSNICDITQSTFSEVYSLYKSLSNEDLETVDSYVDLADAKISDSMKELISVFTKTPNAPKNTEWNQTGAITLIMIIAVIGMTSITVFFLLKTKNIIK
jgi:hypothetical protein